MNEVFDELDGVDSYNEGYDSWDLKYVLNEKIASGEISPEELDDILFKLHEMKDRRHGNDNEFDHKGVEEAADFIDEDGSGDIDWAEHEEMAWRGYERDLWDYETYEYIVNDVFDALDEESGFDGTYHEGDLKEFFAHAVAVGELDSEEVDEIMQDIEIIFDDEDDQE